MALIVIGIVVLSILIYSVVCAFVFALCKSLNIGADDYYEEDFIPKLISAFWPIGFWFLLIVVLSRLFIAKFENICKTSGGDGGDGDEKV